MLADFQICISVPVTLSTKSFILDDEWGLNAPLGYP